MVDLTKKEYVVVIQCDIVKQRCPGYLCEKAFHERSGGFSEYPKEKACRVIYMTCSGCCGRAVHRKLTLLKRSLKKKENIDKDKIVVQLSSCMTKDNYHAPPCPHLDYIKTLIERVGIDCLEDTEINPKSEEKRKEGLYTN
ncbi:MAG: CGGC domain-containing protein [Sedimentisphaerales bacterium]|nr:CGGC domain-containing protein [Sedimentisphaerales bacterium]